MNKLRIILASASPRRDELLNLIGLPHEILITDADETPNSGPPEGTGFSIAEWYARSASMAKAEVAEKEVFDGQKTKSIGKTIIVAADTVVSPDGNRVFGKPIGANDAIRMLSELSGCEHIVIGGITVSDGTRRITRTVSTYVRMKRLTEDDIYAYVKTGEPFGKAGAYAIQGRGAVFIESIRGDYPNVVGISASVLRDILKFDFSIEML